MERMLGPLPESAFVAAARDTMPAPRERVTTATRQGNLRGRATRGRSTAGRTQGRGIPQTTQPRENRGRARQQQQQRRRPAPDHDAQDMDQGNTARGIPDLNAFVHESELEEFPLSQNAPLF